MVITLSTHIFWAFFMFYAILKYAVYVAFMIISFAYIRPMDGFKLVDTS